MKKQTIITGLYLAALMVMILGLVGCAKRGNQSGGEIQTPQSDTLVQKGKDNETQELTLCTDRNKDGFFSIWRFNEKYGTICYTDLKQKNRSFCVMFRTARMIPIPADRIYPWKTVILNR